MHLVKQHGSLRETGWGPEGNARRSRDGYFAPVPCRQVSESQARRDPTATRETRPAIPSRLAQLRSAYLNPSFISPSRLHV